MKVLNIIPTLNKGGAEKLVLDICEELSLRPNKEVKLLVLSSENTFELSKYSFEIKFINIQFQFNIYKPDLCENINEADLYIDQFSPDIIHTHLFESEIFTRLKKRDNVKYFSHIHYNTKELTKPSLSNLFSKKGLIDLVVYRKLLNVYKNVNNSFISISPDSDNFHKENIPQFKNRIHLLKNAIKTSAYKSQIRDENDKLKLISIGSLIIRKNQRFQLEIAEKLLATGINFELNIVGDGPDKELLIKNIKELKLQNNVNMIGLSNEIPKLLSQNNIFLHTASYEPFGLVLIEAMASSLPVIALNGSGNKEIVENGVTGFFIDQQDPDIFVEKILTIWNDQDEYKKMSTNALSKSKSYDIVPYIDRLIEIYNA